jgi:hypothetical protein
VLVWVAGEAESEYETAAQSAGAAAGRAVAALQGPAVHHPSTARHLRRLPRHQPEIQVALHPLQDPAQGLEVSFHKAKR